MNITGHRTRRVLTTSSALVTCRVWLT